MKQAVSFMVVKQTTLWQRLPYTFLFITCS